MVRITPIYNPKQGHLEGEQPYLGNLLTMVINHLRTYTQLLHSVKLTANAPENRPKPKRNRSYSNHPFSGANLLLVSGRVKWLGSSPFFFRQNKAIWKGKKPLSLGDLLTITMVINHSIRVLGSHPPSTTHWSSPKVTHAPGCLTNIAPVFD